MNVLPDDYHQKEFYLLRERKVDLCVAVISNSELDDDLKAEIFYKDRPFIVTGRNNRLASKRRVELAELIGEVWLLSHNLLIKSSLATAFRAQGLPFPEVRMRSYSVHQRLNLLAKDGFLAAEFGSILRFNADRYPLLVSPVHSGNWQL